MKNKTMNFNLFLICIVVESMKIDFQQAFKEYYIQNGERKYKKVVLKPIPKYKRTFRLVERIHRLQIVFRKYRYKKSGSKILNWWLKIQRFKCINNLEESSTLNYLRQGGKDLKCPITLEKIPTRNSIKIILPNGVIYAYTLTSLVKYIKNSGEFNCVCTRIEFKLPTIKRIQSKAFALGFLRPNQLITMFEDRENIRKRVIEHQNAILAIETSCQIVFGQMLAVCADDEIDTDSALEEIENQLFPEWYELISDFRNFDIESSRVLLQSNKMRIEQLRQDVNNDVHGLLHRVLDHVEYQNRRVERSLQSRGLFSDLVRSINSTEHLDDEDTVLGLFRSRLRRNRG